jgi:anti-anti-sigma factor
LELHETEFASAVVLAAHGRLDATSSPALELRLREMVAAGRTRIVLDLERVGFISSAGLRVLVVAGKLLAEHAGRMILAEVSFLASIGIRILVLGAKQQQRRGGSLVLLNPHPDAEKLLEMTGIIDLLPIMRDEVSAIAAVTA